MRDILRAILPLLGDSIYNRVNYQYLHRKVGVPTPRLDLAHPRRFNEKIIWLKTRYRHPGAAVLADKVRVKEHVAKLIGPEHVIPTFGVFSSAEEIDFDSLPESFVLKANHGSGWNLIVTDKRSLDYSTTRKTLNGWLQRNYYRQGREYQYRDIPPRILAEKLLRLESGGDLRDFKFFCFDGQPMFVQVDFDRHVAHKRNFYSTDWERLPFTILFPAYPGDEPRPRSLEAMVEIASRLSSGLPFVRVDLYECDGTVFFGELTFHPGGGFEPISPPEWDVTLGDFLHLPSSREP